jgi:hypothetical protein
MAKSLLLSSTCGSISLASIWDSGVTIAGLTRCKWLHRAAAPNSSRGEKVIDEIAGARPITPTEALG